MLVQDGSSCLSAACEDGHLGVVKYLYGCGGEALLMLTTMVSRQEAEVNCDDERPRAPCLQHNKYWMCSNVCLCIYLYDYLIGHCWVQQQGCGWTEDKHCMMADLHACLCRTAGHAC